MTGGCCCCRLNPLCRWPLLLRAVLASVLAWLCCCCRALWVSVCVFALFSVVGFGRLFILSRPPGRLRFARSWCVDVVFALSLQRCADVHRVRRAGLLVCLACTLMYVCVSLKKCADLHFVNTLGQSVCWGVCVFVRHLALHKETFASMCVACRRFARGWMDTQHEDPGSAACVFGVWQCSKVN